MQRISKTKIKLFSSLKLKKNRQKQGLFLVEGRKLTQEALQSNWIVQAVIVRQDKVEDYAELLEGQEEIYSIENEDFKLIHSLQSPEGILAVVKLPEFSPNPEEKLKGPAFLLEEIQDPGNLGTLIRTAGWFGFEQVYCSKGCVDAFNPKVLRASMGAVFHTRVIYLEEWEKHLEAIKSSIFVGHLKGKELQEVNIPSDAFILIGNEARGVSQQLLEKSEIQKIRIPGSHKVESLNAANAGSILAWELYKNKLSLS
ncbi:MAG: RNA methyltransferase [Bacteroidia bacterium]|nr:RNA methyltransferase [Bacteroidia bacterium]